MFNTILQYTNFTNFTVCILWWVAGFFELEKGIYNTLAIHFISFMHWNRY